MGWGAFVSALGSIGSSALSLWNTGKQHERNKEMAKYVGQNAHQWEVDDLRNAGLNPILSSGGTGNAGGSSPTSFVTPDFGQSINAGRLSSAQSQLLREQINSEKQKQDMMSSEEYKNLRLGHLYGAQELNTTAQNALLDLQIPVAKRNAEYQLSNYGDVMYGLGMFTNSAGGLIGKLPSMK